MVHFLNSYLSSGILKYPEFGIVCTRAKEIKEFFIVELQKRHSNRVLLDVVGVQLFKQLVK